MAEADIPMTEDTRDHEIYEHDSWNYSPVKTRKAPRIKIDEMRGVLPFDGVRNASGRSNSSHRIHFTYKTEANNWVPKHGICESAAEFYVALDVLLSPDVYDIRFQPSSVEFICQVTGKKRTYTHDILVVMRNGVRLLLFVRNAESLRKEITWRQIDQIESETIRLKLAHKMEVVDANAYSRQRRDNLLRLWTINELEDPVADDQALDVMRSKPVFLMKDIFPHVTVEAPRVFDAVYRLVARGRVCADLDKVLWEHSKVWLP